MSEQQKKLNWMELENLKIEAHAQLADLANELQDGFSYANVIKASEAVDALIDQLEKMGMAHPSNQAMVDRNSYLEQQVELLQEKVDRLNLNNGKVLCLVDEIFFALSKVTDSLIHVETIDNVHERLNEIVKTLEIKTKEAITNNENV